MSSGCSGTNFPSLFSTDKVYPKDYNNWNEFKRVTLAGSKDSTFPELATIILLELFLGAQENCVTESRQIKKDINNLFCIINFLAYKFFSKIIRT